RRCHPRPAGAIPLGLQPLQAATRRGASGSWSARSLSRIALALLWLMHWLPLRVIDAIGRGLGSAVFWLIPERRRVTRINLGRCFLQMTPARREQVAGEHFRAACRSIVNLGVLWWASRERVERMVRVEGLEHLRALDGTPSILLAPHFIGVDIGGSRLGGE